MTVSNPVLSPSPSGRSAVADPSIATTELESVASSGTPATGLFVLAAWVACGLGVAFLMQRRGHDGRALAGLGVALGPLLAPFAVHLARTRGPSAHARVLAPGRPGSGIVDVLVGFPDVFVDPGPLASHLAALGFDELDVRRVTVAGLIDEETARSWRWIELTADAARELSTASDRILAPVIPSRVLVPGETVRELRQYGEAEGYAVLVLVSTLQTEVVQLGRDHR